MLVYEGAKKIPNFLSDEQISILLSSLNNYPYHKGAWGSWCKSRDRLIILFGLTLGLRPMEACYIAKTDIDLQKGIVRVRGDNNKQKADRILRIPSILEAPIRDYLKFSQLVNIQSDFFFPSRQNEKLSPRTLKGKFRQILKLAGLWEVDFITEHGQRRPNFRFYSLRHTFGSKVYNHSKDIFLVANMLGHRKLESSKVYVHTDKDYGEYQKEKLEELFLK